MAWGSRNWRLLWEENIHGFTGRLLLDRPLSSCIDVCPISKLFGDVALMDDPAAKDKKCILDCTSAFYTSERLWTYGCIRALLGQGIGTTHSHPKPCKSKVKT